jgi:hypothetical protein
MAEDIKSVVVARTDDGVRNGYAVTGGSDTPNLMVRALSPLRVIVIRTSRVYLQSVTGFVTAGLTGFDSGIMPDDFGALFVLACKLGVATAAVTALQNFGELLAKLDQKYPELRA